MPLLVISLHEHAQLVPETLAAPLLIGGGLLCSRDQRAGAGGGALALAACCKFAFLLPAVAIVIAARRRIQTAVALGLGLAALAVVTQLAFGSAAWRGVVEAQLQVGTSSLRNAAGLITQVVWNEFPLVALALAAVWWWLRLDGTAPERCQASTALLRTLGAAVIAGLLHQLDCGTGHSQCRARRCPAVPVSTRLRGSSYLAFLSGRRMPGEQPDLFIIATARVDARFAARAARDQPRCPVG